MTVEYPCIETVRAGYRVRISQGAYLPGYYTNRLMAEKAVALYRGKQAEAAANRKSKSKGD